MCITSPAVADPYCRPTKDRDQIAKAGNVSPVGYLASGLCCIQFIPTRDGLMLNSPADHARLDRLLVPPATAFCFGSRDKTRFTCTACH